MLDIRYVRENFEEVTKRLATRGGEFPGLAQFQDLDVRRRQLINDTEELKNKRNTVSKQVAELKREKKDANYLITEMREVGDKIKQIDEELKGVEEKLQEILLTLPNLPNGSIPVGFTEDDNVPVRKWGEPTTFTFEPKPHWDLIVDLDIVDFERAGKVTGSRFAFYKGLGARLERALINFMMDLHEEEHGYTEMLPPYLVNRASMTGTGQLPKFEEDAFKIREEDFFLIPTAEVPVTNYHRDEILDGEQLPITYVAYSACFRSEAGSAGRDTRGLIRHHQFNKVELVRFVKPGESYKELEIITGHAEKVLQLLKLPYRVINLCTGDIGFSSAQTYDIEVWLPSYDAYKEISSCSNFEDFQARRASIRYRKEAKAKPEFVHTLNGSGLAIERTVAAIIENYQREDGSVVIPEVLRPYMKNLEVIKK